MTTNQLSRESKSLSAFAHLVLQLTSISLPSAVSAAKAKRNKQNAED